MSQVFRLSELCWFSLDDCGHPVVPVPNKQCTHGFNTNDLAEVFSCHMPPTFICGCVADGSLNIVMTKRAPKHKIEELEEELKVIKRSFQVSSTEVIPIEEFLLANEEMEDSDGASNNGEEEDLNIENLQFTERQWPLIELPFDVVPLDRYRVKFKCNVKGNTLSFFTGDINTLNHHVYCDRCAPHYGWQSAIGYVSESIILTASALGRLSIPNYMRPSFYILIENAFNDDKFEIMDYMSHLTVNCGGIELMWELHCSSCFESLIYSIENVSEIY